MDIFADVIARLAALDYTALDSDRVFLTFNIEKAEAELKAATNQLEVPAGLYHTWVDMAAGLFLSDKKSAGALNCLYNFEAPVKSISEGDTSVSFAISDSGSFESQFDAMLKKMITPDADLIIAYRRLAW